jgi:hypothetical protein
VTIFNLNLFFLTIKKQLFKTVFKFLFVKIIHIFFQGLMIISSVVIRCSSVSETEFQYLKEEIGVFKQDFYNDLKPSLKNLKTEVESLNILINEKETDFNEGLFFFFKLLIFYFNEALQLLHKF